MIDVNFDFTLDSPGYWDNFWGEDDLIPSVKVDPDVASETLARYNQLLWSKPLPNGDTLHLELAKMSGSNYLKCGDRWFSSDNLICSYAYYCQKEILKQLHPSVADHRRFVEYHKHRAYTIGGTMMWPCHPQSINQCRGVNKVIRDRFDRTIECVRRFYGGEESPLTQCFECDRDFFDLFVDFKGFIDFFFLQDMVTSDYSEVIMWLGDEWFDANPLPQTIEEYRILLTKQYDFMDARNRRIADWASENL